MPPFLTPCIGLCAAHSQTQLAWLGIDGIGPPKTRIAMGSLFARVSPQRLSTTKTSCSTFGHLLRNLIPTPPPPRPSLKEPWCTAMHRDTWGHAGAQGGDKGPSSHVSKSTVTESTVVGSSTAQRGRLDEQERRAGSIGQACTSSQKALRASGTTTAEPVAGPHSASPQGSWPAVGMGPGRPAHTCRAGRCTTG